MQEKPKDVPSVGRKTQWCKRQNRWRLQSEKRPEANCQAPICETCRTITLGPVERLLVLMSFKWTNKNMLQVTSSIFFLFSETQPKANCQAQVCETSCTITLGPVEIVLTTLLIIGSF